eukprot:1149463-Pelagomonas_calceolata.AAC.2
MHAAHLALSTARTAPPCWKELGFLHSPVPLQHSAAAAAAAAAAAVVAVAYHSGVAVTSPPQRPHGIQTQGPRVGTAASATLLHTVTKRTSVCSAQ